jgi:hypothetical protein
VRTAARITERPMPERQRLTPLLPVA